MKHLFISLILVFCSKANSYDICVSNEHCFVAMTLKNALIYSVTTPTAKPEVEVDYDYTQANGLIMALAMMESSYALKELSALTDYYFGDKYDDALEIAVRHKGKAIIKYLNAASNRPSSCKPFESKYCRTQKDRPVFINKLINAIAKNS